MNERDVVMATEQADDLIGLTGAHQPVIDEHTGELLADRLMDQHRRDRRIDLARQPADYAALADLRSDFRDLGCANFSPRPVARTPADMARVIGDEARAIGGLDALRVALQRVIAAIVVCEHVIGSAEARPHTSAPG